MKAKLGVKAMAETKSQPRHKSDRFSIRVSARQKEVIATAARLSRITISEFVLEQSYQAARQIVADQTSFTLTKKEWKAFCAALDAPPKTIPALRKLLTKPSVFDAK
ncbi:MAG: DUF1778 domain-containing protein [Blastocatellia bacterium]